MDDTRPFARIDRAGLLWLLHGDRLLVLTEDAATIETVDRGAPNLSAGSRTSPAVYWLGNWSAWTMDDQLRDRLIEMRQTTRCAATCP